jgi:hypothetical protein
MAYVLLRALRRIGSHDTDLATATCGTISLKLLKTGDRACQHPPHQQSYSQIPSITQEQGEISRLDISCLLAVQINLEAA